MTAPGLLHRWLTLVALLTAPTLAAAENAPKATPRAAGLEFFEQKIRPVLVRECYSCHSAAARKDKGGLKLDTRAGLLTGGDSGPAVVPGKPTESLLLKALRHDELAMPPKGKLPDEVVADFERWVKMGAPDPRDGKAAAAKAGIDVEAGRQFWSFRPLARVTPPSPAHTTWPRTDVDRFIAAALEAKGLTPGRDTDRRTLLRRLTIDLLGLPPTPQEMDAFLADPTPDDEAIARVVDRLLASPHFGERWGRHWLDVARYADSNGRDENLTFHEAWRYRDYVVRALNEDKPYDRFVREQIAGDLLPAAGRPQRDELLTATGFLVVGPKVLADRDLEKRKMDVVDEQIDTIGRTFLGMTLGCARCHDHKFDPIPTADYYALAGILSSTHTLDGFKLGNPIVSGWMLRPLGGPEAEKQLAARKEHEKKLKDLAAQIKKAKSDLTGAQDKAAMRSTAKLVGITVDDSQAKLVGMWKASTFSKPYVGEGYVHDDRAGKGEKSATFTPDLPVAGEYEVFVSYTGGKGRADNVPVTVQFDGGTKSVTLDQSKPAKLDGLFASVGKYRFAKGTAGSVTLGTAGTVGHVIVDAVRFVPQGALEKDVEMAMGVPEAVRKQLTDARTRVEKLEAEEKKLKAAAPPAPEMVLAVRDEEKVENCKICIRGNPHQFGAEVPRGVLSVASKNPRPKIAAGQSGRVELADWLASADNPLTARVMVNRVWMHLVGEGLVRTVDNFGIQGEKPTHPELLDWLAGRFVAGGWSVKKLVRLIATSRVYRLSCQADAALVKADPENRLLGRAFRRRVEAEVIRDTILAVSGDLDRSMGGSSVSTLGERAIDNESKGGLQTEVSQRRSVYLPVIRNDLPAIFEVFDFADPDTATGKRDATTVATQALFLMNNPFALTQAKVTAQRLVAAHADDTARLNDLYRRALGRTPSAAEAEAALGFLARCREAATSQKGTTPADADTAAWANVCLAVFGCTEFRFVE
jgi:hypothetical protein